MIRISRFGRFALKYLCSVISCLHLFTIGLFSTKGLKTLNEITILFGYDFLLEKKWKIPQIDIYENNKDVPIMLLESFSKKGNVTLLELVVINILIRNHNPNLIFEIGTFDGRTTLNMAANSSAESKIYSLDLPKEQHDSAKLPLSPSDSLYIKKDISGARYLNIDKENKICQIYGDSAGFDFSPYFNKIDFVFVDGAHTYEYVLNDTKIALKLLRNNGIILWHDYGVCDGVTKAMDELYSKNRDLRGVRHIKGTSLIYLKQNC